MINSNSQMNDDIVIQEQNYFLQVLKTFDNYKKQSLLQIEYKEKCLAALPAQHQKWLTRYKKDLSELRRCVEVNASYIPIVVEHANNIFENLYESDNISQEKSTVGTLSEGLDKVQSVFKQLMRDWSSLGAKEREECYEPIIEAVELEFPEDSIDRRDVRVLVPGAGLGRLAFEIAKRRFNCQGNEFNMFMLIVSFHVLNHCKKVDEFEAFPWVHQYCNNLSIETQTLGIRFPDVPTRLDDLRSQFSMTAGDFLEVYTEPAAFDCVATCFFVDCASNIVEFVETIYNVLKPNGVWINLGPLLYHYSHVEHVKSIEPSFAVLCDVIAKVGFSMEKRRTGLKTRYCQNPEAMLQYEYDSVFLVCRKPAANGDCLGKNDSENPRGN